jgi:drug/metabolite transporter (DMT)-like permease
MAAPLRDVVPALFLLGSVWGLTPALAKKLMAAAGWSPMLAALAAATGSAAILLGVCAARRQAVPLDGPHLRHYAVAGLSGWRWRISVPSPACSMPPPGCSPCSSRSRPC